MKLTSLILVTTCLAVCGVKSAKQSDHNRAFIFHEKNPKNNSIVAKTVLSIIDNYFAKGYPQVDLYICGEKLGPSETLANEILRLKKDKVKSRLFGVENQSYNLTTSSIILFDSVEKFKQTVGKIEWLTNEEKRYRHLVYIPGVTNSDIVENISNGFLIDHVNFLMHESPESIELVASYMFTALKCRENQLITINRFMKNTSKWEGSTFYPKKYQNLHNCPLYHAATEKVYKLIEPYFNEELLVVLGSFQNFRVKFNLEEEPKLPLYKYYDLIPAVYSNVKLKFSDIVLRSVATGSQKYVLIVPPGEPYTPFEKMYIMFDEGLWIAIGLTFSFCAIVILIVNQCSAKVQNVVYGPNIRTPFVNLLDIFLNGGQMKVPSRYFARILLILFVTWSLIIRTCYQSMMFDYLQTDMRKPPVQSLDELIERNFTLIGPPGHNSEFGYDDWLPDGMFKLNFEPYSKDITDRQKTHGEKYIHYYMKYVTEPEHRSTMMIYDTGYDYISRYRYRSGTPSLIMLDENIMTLFLNYQMLSFNPFWDEFDENIGKLNSNGLNAKWVKEIKGHHRAIPNDEVGAQVLTFEHLETCFWICMAPAVLATIVFIIEISIPKVRALNKFLREALVFWFTIKAFKRSNRQSNVTESNVLLANELRLQRIEILENAPSESSKVV